MRYEHMIQGTFISRPNRFIAHVAIRREAGGEEETVVCHVKNTGRCRELLLPGAGVILQFHPEAAALGRKTEYSLIGVLKERNGELLLINMDSQAPNQVAAEWLHAMEQAPTLPVSGYDGEKFLPALRLANIRREVNPGSIWLLIWSLIWLLIWFLIRPVLSFPIRPSALPLLLHTIHLPPLRFRAVRNRPLWKSKV